MASKVIEARLSLDEAIQQQVRGGFRVTTRTDKSASMVKPKSFSVLIFVVLLLLGLFPGLVYVGWYMAKHDQTVYINETGDGHIQYQFGH